MRSETHFCFPESFRFPFGNLFLLAPNTICKKYKLPFYFRIELVQGYYSIIFVIIKPLHPKLAHAFGYRLSLSVSMHSQTWPVTVTVTKRALLSRSLPVPRSTADETSNHSHFIVEEDSFAVQLTFSDGNCNSSIYLLAFHLCFVSKTWSFCLQITYIRYMFVDHTVFMTFGHSKLVRQQKCN